MLQHVGLFFYCEYKLAPYLINKLDDHPLSVFCDFLSLYSQISPYFPRLSLPLLYFHSSLEHNFTFLFVSYTVNEIRHPVLNQRKINDS